MVKSSTISVRLFLIILAYICLLMTGCQQDTSTYTGEPEFIIDMQFIGEDIYLLSYENPDGNLTMSERVLYLYQIDGTARSLQFTFPSVDIIFSKESKCYYYVSDNNLNKFSPEDNSASTISPLLFTGNFSAATQNYIVISDPDAIREPAAYSIAEDQWTTLSSLPKTRIDFLCYSDDYFIYYSSFGIYQYDIKTNTSTELLMRIGMDCPEASIIVNDTLIYSLGHEGVYSIDILHPENPQKISDRWIVGLNSADDEVIFVEKKGTTLQIVYSDPHIQQGYQTFSWPDADYYLSRSVHVCCSNHTALCYLSTSRDYILLPDIR